MRIEYPGALYHITSRGNDRKKLYLSSSDRTKFLEMLESYHERHGILIHSYALMDNHYHLILETPLGNLTKVMHGLNSGYTGYFNRTYKRTGHLFQGRYKAILVDREAYLLELSRYIHLNPVRAKVVERPEQYPWSSYPGYLWRGKGVPWVEYAWVLSRFGHDRAHARKKYREFIQQGITEKQENPLKKIYGQMLLGDAVFLEKTRAYVKGEPISQEIVERKKIKNAVKPKEIIHAVASAFKVEEEKVTEPGGRGNKARKVALYLIKRYSAINNREIGKLFGGLHYSSVSKSSARMEKEMAQDKNLSRLTRGLVSHVKT